MKRIIRLCILFIFLCSTYVSGLQLSYTLIPEVHAEYIQTVEDTTLSLPYTSEVIQTEAPFTGLAASWELHESIDVSHVHSQEVEFILEVKVKGEDNQWGKWFTLAHDHDTKDIASTKEFSQMEFVNTSSELMYRILPISDAQHTLDVAYFEIVTFQNTATPKLQLEHSRAQAIRDNLIVTREEWGADPKYLVYQTWAEERDRLCEDKPWYCNTTPNAREQYKEALEKYERDYPEDSKVTSVIRQYKGQDVMWPVAISDHIKTLVVHHSASVNKDINGDGVITTEDEKAAIRSIYYFHSITRGWGDIGYNYLVGPSGTIYEGRYGGDKAVGAHVLWRNVSSIGVSNLGNFEEESFGSTQKQGLVRALAYLSKKYQIDPTKNTVFHKKVIPTIVGHGDAGGSNTSCPGLHLREDLDSIRQYTKAALTYVGAISSYSLPGEPVTRPSEGLNGSLIPTTDLYNFEPGEEKELLLKVRNTGTKEWDSRTYIRLDSPADTYLSILSGEQSTEKAAYVSNTPVKPGEVATFKIQLQAKYKEFRDNVYAEPIANGQYAMSKFYIPFSVNPAKLTYTHLGTTMPKTKLAFQEEATALISLKNTGNAPWYAEGEMRITLAASRPNGRDSSFTHSSTMATLREKTVFPGQVGTFEMRLKAPQTEQTFTEYFTPVIEGYGFLEDKNMNISVAVVHPTSLFAYLFRQESTESIDLGVGQQTKVRIPITNAGNISWNNMDDFLIDTKFKGSAPFSLLNQAYFDRATVGPRETSYLVMDILAGQQGFSGDVLTKIFVGDKPLFNTDVKIHISISEGSKKAAFLGASQFTEKIGYNEQKTLKLYFRNTGKSIWKPGSVKLTSTESLPALSGNLWEGARTIGTFDEVSPIEPNKQATFSLTLYGKEKGIHIATFQLEDTIGQKLQIDPITITVHVESQYKGTGEPMLAHTTFSTLEFGSYIRKAVGKLKVTVPKRTITRTEHVNTNTNTSTITTLTPTDSSQASSEIKVLLRDVPDTQSIESHTGAYIVQLDKRFITEVNPGQKIFVYRDGTSKISVSYSGGVKSGSLLEIIPREETNVVGIVNWIRDNYASDDHFYRGGLHIRNINNRLETVNVLAFSDYMKGIAEQGLNEPIEKQKAIAIISRSYAKWYMDPTHRKPANTGNYHVSDDPDEYQRYRGYNFEQRNPRWLQALEATKELIVTYNNQLVKTPYFNESDGRTRSAQEKWGWTDTPYLQAKDDAYCKEGNGTLKGHGVGLSGCGADTMARNGWSYDQILKYYYTGISLQSYAK